MNLLIVDDERFAIDGILEGVNWSTLTFAEILTANSYAQAIEVMSKKRIDILLCDIEMPDESGLELIAWTNKNMPNTACIILSCHDEFDFARKAVELRCLEYLLKPIRYENLRNSLASAIEKVSERNLSEFLESYGQMYINTISNSVDDKDEDIVMKTAKYIEGHLSEYLSVNRLANMVFISPDHLTRSFKKKYQQTLSEFILKKRMIMAGELLKGSTVSITVISDKVGFGNYSYFTEQFKRYYGLTPREYQKKFGFK